MPCSSSAASFMFVQSHWLHVGLLDCTDYIFRPYQTFGIASIPLRTKICLCKLLDVSRSACSYRAIQSLSPAWYTSPFTQSPKCLPFNADCTSITQFSFSSHGRYNTFIDLLVHVGLFSNIGCISLSQHILLPRTLLLYAPVSLAQAQPGQTPYICFVSNHFLRGTFPANAWWKDTPTSLTKRTIPSTTS